MIKIGITPRFFYESTMKTVIGPKTVSYVINDFMRFFCSNEVMPILIPDVASPLLENYLQQLDGFVLQGGSDVDPTHYGEKHLDKEKWPGDPYRDKFELKVIDYAVKQKMPILGICRGFQILNVYFGGTLIQDIPSQRSSEVTHRNSEAYDANIHLVRILPKGIFNAIYHGKKEIKVNSLHHQGVKALGKGLHAEAICDEDDLIEAFSGSDGQVLGVQWHPEFAYTKKDEVIDPMPLLNYFVSNCKKSKRG